MKDKELKLDEMNASLGVPNLFFFFRRLTAQRTKSLQPPAKGQREEENKRPVGTTGQTCSCSDSRQDGRRCGSPPFRLFEAECRNLCPHNLPTSILSHFPNLCLSCSLLATMRTISCCNGIPACWLAEIFFVFPMLLPPLLLAYHWCFAAAPVIQFSEFSSRKWRRR